MTNIDGDRRRFLGWCSLAPLMPTLLSRAALAASTAREHDRVVVVIRLMGGNDGLNAVVPIRDDRYYRLRPTIAIAARDTLRLPTGDRGLSPDLAAWHDLMEDGHAGILQGVGYPQPSRSHSRATEIWETGDPREALPATGWLGRYIDALRDPAAVEAIQFADNPGRMLASASGRDRLVGDPELLLAAPLQAGLPGAAATGSALGTVLASQRRLAETAAQLRRARRASGRRHPYPAGAFGAALRWTADLIEAQASPRCFHLALGAFEPADAPSFDTHVDEREKHARLYPQLGAGLRAFTRQLRRSGDFGRVLVITVSDFGRQVAENRTRGTDHGDAGLLFYAGGGIAPGLTGTPADLGRTTDGGLDHSVDFRGVYAEIFGRWLGVDPEPLLGGAFAHAGILHARA